MMSTNKRDTALEHILMVLEYNKDEKAQARLRKLYDIRTEHQNAA